jgi:hypothetical protein
MVHSPKLVVADGKHQTGGGFTLGEIICFGSLEFITDCFGNFGLSNEGNVIGIVLVGMAHNRSLSLHTILEESANEGDTTSSGGEALASPSLKDAT